MTTWQTYEDAARAVLSDLRNQLGVSDVEAKQKLRGASGTEWEIDGKAVLSGQSGFLILEARKHTTSGQKQEAVAAVAYRVQDLGAQGGVIVSPLALQQGAQLLANHENIAHIRLEAWSTADDYLAHFMGKNFHKASATSNAIVTDQLDGTIYRNGKPVP